MNAPDNVIYEFGPFLLEPQARRLSRNGESLPLAAPEFELLLLLVRNCGRVVDKNEIMAAVWPDVEVEENNLTVRMSSLRRSLGETKGHHPYIQTVTGRGYCLTVHVNELTAGPVPVSNIKEVTSTSEPEDNEPARKLVTRSRKWEIGGLRLYSLLIVGLLGVSLVYALLWRRKSETPVHAMRMSRVTQSGRVAWAAIAPDGKHIAYVERDGELHSLWLQRVGTPQPLQLLAPAKLTYKEIAFSPDGNTIYYSKCQPSCNLHKMPVLGGVETALPVRADSPVTFAPDGKRMAYVRVDAVGSEIEMNLLIANTDGTSEEVVLSRTSGTAYQYGAPAWSPDGKMIAVALLVREDTRSYMKVVGVRVEDRVESTLTTQPWSWIKDVSWSPDGGSLIINARDAASSPDLAMQIWRVPLTGGEPSRITNDLNNYYRTAVSTDGSTLMAVQIQWTSGLWIAPVENPSSGVQVTHGTIDRQDGSLGLSMSPDGRLIYTSMRSGQKDLFSVNADGSDLKQLTDGPHRDHYPVATPDGRYVVFESSRDGAHGIWRVDVDGRNPKRLTQGGGYDSEPVCSPDSKWVVYVSDAGGGNPRLRKISIEGGEPLALTDDFAQHPTFSPDGKTIAYYFMDKKQRDRREIILIPAQGGKPIKTMPAPKNFGAVMRWSPGGNSLSYRDGTLSAIWSMPFDGTPPTMLVNLRGHRLHTFSYSHDGRRLAYASGPNLSDVILITGFN